MAVPIPSSHVMTSPAQLTALAILPDRTLAQQFLQALSQSRAFQISAEWTSYPAAAKLMAQLRQAAPDVLLIDVSSDRAQGATIIEAVCSSPRPVPMATFGGGIKYAIRPRVLLRVEVRDYFSRFPTRVIAPAPGSHLAGWLHDLVPMIGISFVF